MSSRKSSTTTTLFCPTPLSWGRILVPPHDILRDDILLFAATSPDRAMASPRFSWQSHPKLLSRSLLCPEAPLRPLNRRSDH